MTESASVAELAALDVARAGDMPLNGGADLGEDRVADLAPLGPLLRQGLNRAVNVANRTERLGELLISGRPSAIADGAMMVELSMSAAEPVFAELARALDRLGMPRLQDLANHLRRCDQDETATAADALRLALTRFAKRNAGYQRRAQGLSRGLTASLKALHALGMAGSGRLLAEA